MTRILITGEDSFIGRNYMRYSKYDKIDEISFLGRKPSVTDFTGYDVVLHLIAIVHQSARIPDTEYFKVNRDLSVEIAKLAGQAGVRQFIFLSTIKVYGDFLPEMGFWNEQTPCNPGDAYGRSKLAAELGLRELESPDFKVAIVRTPLVYGPGVKANMKSIIKLVDRWPVLPLGRIDNERYFTYIENLVELIDLITEQYASGIYIAMDEESLSTTELVRIISSALDKKRFLFRIPGFMLKLGSIFFPDVVSRLFGTFKLDNTFTKEKLGYNPGTKAREGIFKTVKAKNI